jgi:hypothetical protein
VLHLAFTPDAGHHAAELSRRIGERVVGVDAIFTLTELAVVEARVLEHLDALEAAGIAAWSVGIDTRTNRIEFELEDFSENKTARLRARFGPALAVSSVDSAD